ncbi:hypothetical protein K469DRAFT_740268 [Zopfia rhizophila CBS 207.26]|uniref:MADS-box domain-containing protein n=1 Tax=Zopfia rhizophila CBS 207.26 TaxID=1314779 RepID=A0A6A6DUB2_9PEZI|nr:hypothetical protein K469DRAFT_740268 [Zopfia rhizophila CBS 207.26]
MATKGKVTKITKDDQTSRRKRTKGVINKSHELGVKPSCKVFTFVLYTDVNQVHTYDSTGGEILNEVESVIDRLRHHPSNWQKSDPSSYGSKRLNKKSGRLEKSKGRITSQEMDEPRRPLRPAPVFDLKTLPMYSRGVKRIPGVEAVHDR